MVKRKQTPDHPEEGATYYYAPGGESFASPKIDADAIYKILTNKVIEEGLTKQQRILFQHDLKVEVMDTKKGKVDADLTASLQDMVNAQDVAFNFALQRAWRDVAEWGPALVNPVWDYEGSEYRLLKLKRLPPESFARAGTAYSNIRNRLLPGILVNEATQQIEYWQTDSNWQVRQLTNVEMMTDPIKAAVGGDSSIIPIYPYTKMLTYAWMRQMQKVNQYGSGGIWFLKVVDPTEEDKQYAQKLLKNVSSINRYQLKQNMSIERLGITESGSALETITELGMQMRQFFTPAGLIQKEGGTLIGGSSGPEFELYMAFIAGTHRWLEAFGRKLLNPWLVYNNYYEKGYRIVVDIPAPTVDKSELYLKIHDSGSKEGSLLPNEKRALLRAALPQQAGVDIADLAPEELIELESYNQRIQPMMQLQKIETLGKLAGPIEAPYLLSEKGKAKARKLIQATLGIEEGD